MYDKIKFYGEDKIKNTSIALKQFIKTNKKACAQTYSI